MPSSKASRAADNLGLEIEEYAEFLKDLEATIEDLINEAETAINASDGKKASESLHSIKGSVGSLGFTDTHKLCQTLEDSYKKGITPESLEKLNEMVKLYKNEFIEISDGLL